MNGKAIKSFVVHVSTAALTAVGLMLAGCSSPGAATKTTPPQGTAAKSAAAGHGGAQLWAQNCGHCHNSRSPDSYSDAQWEVAVMHMRVRANLTAEEHKQILAFLKSAH